MQICLKNQKCPLVKAYKKDMWFELDGATAYFANEKIHVITELFQKTIL